MQMIIFFCDCLLRVEKQKQEFSILQQVFKGVKYSRKETVCGITVTKVSDQKLLLVQPIIRQLTAELFCDWLKEEQFLVRYIWILDFLIQFYFGQLVIIVITQLTLVNIGALCIRPLPLGTSCRTSRVKTSRHTLTFGWVRFVITPSTAQT